MSPVASDEMSLLEFRLDGHRFGIACDLVVEVLPMLPVSQLPLAPEAILGVVSVRGTLLPLLDPRPRLGLAGWVASSSAHIVWVRAGDRAVGLVVDSAEDVFSVQLKNVCRPGALEPRVPYSLALVRRGSVEVVVIDIDALVTHDEWRGVANAIDGAQ